MMLFLKASAWSLLLLKPCTANFGPEQFLNAQAAQENRFAQLAAEAQPSDSTCNSTSCYRFYNSKTKPYLIESFPDVGFNVGEIYGGNIPIDKSDPDTNLFFIFKPTTGPPVDELTIWLNGGPGCSSLLGFLQENGPILWQPGTSKPVANPYAWDKLTNMIWVEQPVGTGFAQGNVTATNEVDVAKQFVGFFKNFQTMFGIKNFKIYVTGESYAGRYVPYISAQMLDEKNKEYFNLGGMTVYDPCIGDCGILQMIYPTYGFSASNNEILNINGSILSAMDEMSSDCGYSQYLDKYLTYPPPGHQPAPPNRLHPNCNILRLFTEGVSNNRCFNIYHITDYCPELFDPLGRNPYFNREDVKKAIHAPEHVKWSPCSAHNVFKKDEDSSPLSIIHAIPQVIAATQRVLVANADWDALIPNNGTLLAIQNMTWGGHVGFQSPPVEQFYVPSIQGRAPQGVMGTAHFERGFAYATTAQSGHMQPQYQPRVTWVHLQWLLGRIPSLNVSPK